jgi:predicted RNase H-like nuclease (RuvC/YqgF family)
MFSWKNIQNCYRNKVKDADTTTEKGLGVLEVTAKSIALGTTKVASVIPKLLVDIASKSAIDDAPERKRKYEEAIKDPNIPSEDKKKMQDYLDKYEDHLSSSKDTYAYLQEKIQVPNFTEKLESMEKKKYQKNIDLLTKEINEKELFILKLEKEINELEKEIDSLNTTEEISKIKSEIQKKSSQLMFIKLLLKSSISEKERNLKDLEIY